MVHADRIVYSRPLPVRLAKSLLRLLSKVLPWPLYNALFTTGRRILWFFQRIQYFVKLGAALLGGGTGQQITRLKMVYILLPYTMGGPKALEGAFDIVNMADEEGLQGALVECGVARGGCSAMMGCVSLMNGSNRQIWLFDSFEGLPAPTKDDFIGGKAGEMIGPLSAGMLRSHEDEVRCLLQQKCQIPGEQINIIKGWFQDTLPAMKSDVGKIAVLRLDGDWYESTKFCLLHMYPNVVEGGYLIVDDYATCYGAEKALHEYLEDNQIVVSLNDDGRGGVWFRKPDRYISAE